jgi:hypothetical protein
MLKVRDKKMNHNRTLLVAALAVILSAAAAAQTSPFGLIERSLNAYDGSVAFATNDRIYIKGWAVDPVQGTPSRVSVMIDGIAIGDATLGVSRPDVATFYKNASYANSGWYLQVDIRLAVGNHTVTAIAYGAAGSAPLEHWSGNSTSSVIQVFANTAPFGCIDYTGIANNGRTTMSSIIPAGDDLSVVGWVADAEDGSPVRALTLVIDGIAVSAKFIFQPRKDVAAFYNRPDFGQSGYYVRASLAGVAIGNHQIAVIATDSENAARLMGVRTITVQ